MYFLILITLLVSGVHLHQVVINSFFVLGKKNNSYYIWCRYLEHTSPLFATSSILKLGDIQSLNLANFISKQSRNLLPHKLQGFFLANASVHTHQTRGLAKGNLFVKQLVEQSFFNRVFIIKGSFTEVLKQNLNSQSVFVFFGKSF